MKKYFSPSACRTLFIACCLLFLGQQKAFSQITGDTAVCLNDSATYSVPYTSGYSYVWNVNGGTYSAVNNVCSVVWSIVGTGTVSVTINGNTTYNFNVVVHPRPFPAITKTAGEANCGGHDQSGGSPGGGACAFSACEFSEEVYNANYNATYTYLWYVNGGSIQSGQATSQIHILWGAAGTGTITIYETNQWGCTDSIQKCVTIVPKPLAKFTANGIPDGGVVNICRGGTVNFIDQSVGATAWNWNFGDSTSSSMQNISHIYNSNGTYTAILTVENACHCKDSASITIIVDTSKAPDIQCVSELCPNDSGTYCTSVPCGTLTWVITNGIVLSGGGPTDSCVTVKWTTPPFGYISLTVTGCPGYCATPNVIAVPIVSPVGPVSGDSLVCVGTTSVYTIPQCCGSNITWTLSNPGIGYINSGQGTDQISVSWYSQGNSYVIANYYNPFLGCGGADSFKVKVRQSYSITGNNKVCQGELASYTTGGPGSFFWSATGGLVVSGQGSNTAGILWNAAPDNYILTAVTLSPGLYCNDTVHYHVQILPKPAKPDSILGPVKICGGNSYSYSAIVNNPSGQLSWFAQNGTVSPNTGTPVNVTWGNTGPYSLSVYQTDPITGCHSDTLTLPVDTISPSGIAGSTTVCANSSTNFSISASGASVTWSISPPTLGSVISGQGTSAISVQWNNNPGTGTLQISVCNHIYNVPITVNPAPHPVATVTGNLCGSTPATLGTTLTYSSYNWNGGAGFLPTFTITGSGLYTVQVTDANGCSADTAVNIHYQPGPVASASTPANTNFCIPNPVGATLYALIGAGYTYQWQLNNGNIGGATSPTYNATAAGTYTVIVTDGNGCSNTSNAIIIILSNCPSDTAHCTTNLADQVICSATNGSPACNTVTGINSSTGAANSFTWDFGDGSSPVFSFTTASQTHTYTKAGFYVINVCGLVPNLSPPPASCRLCDTAIVQIPIAADFDSVVHCDTACFTDMSTYMLGNNITGWSWNFGDLGTSTSPSPCHVYATGGTYTVTLTVTSGSCSATISKTVIILAPPVASFSIPASICVGNPVVYNNTSTGFGLHYNWNFGDLATSLLQNPTHTYTTPNTYTNTLLVYNIYGCHDTATQSIIVSPNNLTTSVSATDTVLCYGDSAILTAAGAITYSYLWSNAQTTQNITVYQTGTYSVTVTDPGGCTAQASLLITVVPRPQAIIHLVPASVFCQNNANYLNVCSGANTYQWNTGDSVCNLYVINSGYYAVTVTDTITGCFDTSSVNIVIHPSPAAPIISASNSSVCQGDSITLTVTNYSTGLLWNTGDTTVSIVVYTTGSYSVTYTDSVGCSSSSGAYASINPLPDICSAPSGCYTRCKNDTICVANAGMFASFQWLYNGVPIAGDTGACFVATLSGTYNVILTTPFGCVDTSDNLDLTLISCDSICNVQALFTYNSHGDTTNFSNLSSGNGALHFHWTFGDGDTSNLVSPVHVYDSAAVYTVCLYVTNVSEQGVICHDSFCICICHCNADSTCNVFLANLQNQSITANLAGNPTITFTPPAIQPGDIVIWDYTCDGITDTITTGNNSVIHTYPTSGNYVICARIERIVNGDTCWATLTKFVKANVQVEDTCRCDTSFNSAVAAGFATSISGNTVTFIPLALTNCDTVTWNFADGSPTIITVGNAAVTHTYANNATPYYVCMLVQRAGSPNCHREFCKQIILTGINEYALDDIKIYPNPAHDQIIVNPGNSTLPEHLHIIIRDIMGRRISEQSWVGTAGIQKIDLTQFINGVYSLSFTTGEELLPGNYRFVKY